MVLCALVGTFLSTPSARRATTPATSGATASIDFYPRPPRGGRPIRQQKSHRSRANFYPRPPRGGRPGQLSLVTAGSLYFYPRPPRGGRLSGDVTPHVPDRFLSTPSARRATAKTERKHPAFVSLYTSLHKLQRDVCKPNRKITPLLAQTAGIPVRSVPENHVCCRFALAGHQKISTLSCANSGCSPTCSTLVW